MWFDMNLRNHFNKNRSFNQPFKYDDAVIVFDLGGTYFRAGLYTKNGELIHVSQQSAVSFRSAPDLTVKEVKKKLLDYLVMTARKYAHDFHVNQISISLGAALNGHNGSVYGSAPLWGNDYSPFNLLVLLKQEEPAFNWHIVNDVTAALIHYVHNIRDSNVRKILLMTISSGIACRIFDNRNQHIVLDEFGLQGEIGHLPAILHIAGKVFELDCDCGASNHLSSFSSGRGIPELAKKLAQFKPSLWEKSIFPTLLMQGVNHDNALCLALDKHDEFSLNLLHLATKNIADILRNALSLDPEIDKIVLTGGVVVSLAKHYHASLMQHFSEQGLYLSSYFDPNFFERRIVIADADKVNNLIGAGLYAKKYIKQECHV
jgi:glucokinase